MNTPGARQRGTHSSLYGDGCGSINRGGVYAWRSVLASAAALLLLGGATLPKKGEPPISEQTQRSGGPIDPWQARLAFDTADLAFEVLPEQEALSGVATLSFTARAPLDRIVLDLDHNLPVTKVEIDGAPLRPGAWTNPDGKLTIMLPRSVPAGRHVTARLTYAGTPHVAVKAPWDDGMVWSK